MIGAKRKTILWWIVAWIILVILGSDFANWGRVPSFFLGLPGWLWWDVCLVIACAGAFYVLGFLVWGEE